jgi:hypothetical protein
MTRSILIITLCFAISSCSKQSNRDKAISLIEKFQVDNVEDFGDYNSLEYGEIDSTYTSLYENEVFKKSESKSDKYRQDLYDAINDYNYSKFIGSPSESGLALVKLYQRQYDNELKIQKELEDKFVRKFNGFQINQCGIYSTDFGDSAFFHTYYFDNELSTVINHEFESFEVDIYNELKSKNILFPKNKTELDLFMEVLHDHEKPNDIYDGLPVDSMMPLTY